MTEKENNQRHESTIDKYFSRTADGYNVWAEEDKEKRSFLQIAAEPTGDTDENGCQGFDFHIAYSGRINFLASGIAQTMLKEEFLRKLIIEAANMYFYSKRKIKK